jgi:poly(3-hydroxybutyrate) depolymerase
MKGIEMNSTTANVMAEAEQRPETPIPEPHPAVELPDTSERMRPMHPGAELGWSDHGGMVEQQASANKWAEAAHVERAAMQEMTDSRQESSAVEMTDSRQAVQYSRWSGEPLGETAEIAQSAGIGQSH